MHGDGRVVNGILTAADPRSTLFTGSQAIAERLVVDLRGKVPRQLTVERYHPSSFGDFIVARLCRVGGCRFGLQIMMQQQTRQVLLVVPCAWYHKQDLLHEQASASGDGYGCGLPWCLSWHL